MKQRWSSIFHLWIEFVQWLDEMPLLLQFLHVFRLWIHLWWSASPDIILVRYINKLPSDWSVSLSLTLPPTAVNQSLTNRIWQSVIYFCEWHCNFFYFQFILATGKLLTSEVLLQRRPCDRYSVILSNQFQIMTNLRPLCGCRLNCLFLHNDKVSEATESIDSDKTLTVLNYVTDSVSHEIVIESIWWKMLGFKTNLQ